MKLSLAILFGLLFLTPIYAQPEIIVAEGEAFHSKDDKGWKVTHQNDSYGSHTYGGMWMTHGGCLGAPANSVGSVAIQKIQVTKANKYRVWSKYQAPPYFHYLHQIDIFQNGKKVFSHLYGKNGTDRLWSFSGVSDELWWPWGVDHDAAEAPKKMVALQKGPAEIHLRTVANGTPGGNRYVDCIILTTEPKDTYQGFKPYKVGSPFSFEALAATRLYLRFKNASDQAAQLTVRRTGHFQPQYGGASTKIPENPVPAGQWSSWVNIGPFCRLVHDEGLFLSLPGAEKIAVQFSRDAQGKDICGDFTIRNGQAASVPLEITWKQDAVVRPSEQHAREIIAASKKWRRANKGKKPKKILFYGAFRGKEDWIPELKAALGYNTLLPGQYHPVHRDQMHTHANNEQQIRAVAKRYPDKSKFRIMSFGDEISLGRINYQSPELNQEFRTWLQQQKISRKELGVDPAKATLAKSGNPRLVWYSAKFNEEQRFAAYRAKTEFTKKLMGEAVLTGANFSPHHGVLYYGSLYQWVDLFKHKGMSMYWTEDYIFSVPEVPQIISFQLAQVRCGARYHNIPIHYYAMPHAPGQEPEYLRRNIFAAVGNGAAHIDNFWVAPAENFTENYVSWSYRDTFRTLSEAIYDTAAAEVIQHGGKVRKSRIALITGRATDFNESHLQIDKNQDPFARRCKNAPAKINQNLCRKEQQMLYLALQQYHYPAELITEEDIVEGGALKNYDVVYFAGEWIDTRAVKKLDAWVKQGGILYASAGIGHRNQFGEPNPQMLNLLGLKNAPLRKNLVRTRTLLELPLAQPIDTFSLAKTTIPAMGMRQELSPTSAKVLGEWQTGGGAVTIHTLGKGKAIAIGTCPGITWMKTGVKPVPFARGGRTNSYNPEDFSPATKELVLLGVNAGPDRNKPHCNVPGVELIVLDSQKGTLVTAINWTNRRQKDLQIIVPMAKAPKQVRSVCRQKTLPSRFEKGNLHFSLDLEDADYILLPR